MKACWDRGWVRKILDELLINSPLNQLQGDFFNWASPENVSRLAPPKNALTGPPQFEKVLSMAAERGEIPTTLTFLIPRGGQSGTLTFFFIQPVYI